MSELKLGKITNAELAEWFGTTLKQIEHRKKQYLEKLKEYCEFKPVWGGVEIIEIYKFFYVKNKNYQIVLENFEKYWSPSGLDTCSHVGDQIYLEHQDELTTQLNTTQKHVVQVRNELYGKPFDEIGGPKGKCKYVWCKKDETGTPQFLTEEEEAIKKDLLTKWFGATSEKTILVQEMIRKNEITETEAWQVYSKMLSLPTSYQGFLGEFKKRTNVTLIRGTLIDNKLYCAENDCIFD